MTRKVRLEEIRHLLLSEGRVDIRKMCELFGTSNVTIRNDLSLLEQEGFLIRTHGGAILQKTSDTFIPVFKQPVTDSAVRLEKMRSLAKVAAQHITDNAWIYLSSGMTCYEIAKLLTGRKLNVVAGGLETAIVLSQTNTLSVFVPGGAVTAMPNGCILSGDWYLRSLDELRVEQAFISVSGVDFITGYSVNNSSELLHIKKLKEVSRETIVVTDSTKFNHQAFLSAANLDYVDTVITNRDIPKEYRDFFNAHKVRLITD